MIEYGELFQAWEMWPSPHSEKPVGSEVGQQDPHPRIHFAMGIRSKLYLGRYETCFLLKLPHPELRQQTLLHIFKVTS